MKIIHGKPSDQSQDDGKRTLDDELTAQSFPPENFQPPEPYEARWANEGRQALIQWAETAKEFPLFKDNFKEVWKPRGWKAGYDLDHNIFRYSNAYDFDHKIFRYSPKWAIIIIFTLKSLILRRVTLTRTSIPLQVFTIAKANLMHKTIHNLWGKLCTPHLEGIWQMVEDMDRKMDGKLIFKGDLDKYGLRSDMDTIVKEYKNPTFIINKIQQTKQRKDGESETGGRGRWFTDSERRKKFDWTKVATVTSTGTEQKMQVEQHEQGGSKRKRTEAEMADLQKIVEVDQYLKLSVETAAQMAKDYIDGSTTNPTETILKIMIAVNDSLQDTTNKDVQETILKAIKKAQETQENPKKEQEDGDQPRNDDKDRTRRQTERKTR